MNQAQSSSGDIQNTDLRPSMPSIGSGEVSLADLTLSPQQVSSINPNTISTMNEASGPDSNTNAAVSSPRQETDHKPENDPYSVQIPLLKSFTFTQGHTNLESSSSSECQICLQALSDTTSTVTHIHCKNSWHIRCFYDWIESCDDEYIALRCPLCRKNAEVFGPGYVRYLPDGNAEVSAGRPTSCGCPPTFLIPASMDEWEAMLDYNTTCPCCDDSIIVSNMSTNKSYRLEANKIGVKVDYSTKELLKIMSEDKSMLQMNADTRYQLWKVSRVFNVKWWTAHHFSRAPGKVFLTPLVEVTLGSAAKKNVMASSKPGLIDGKRAKVVPDGSSGMLNSAENKRQDAAVSVSRLTLINILDLAALSDKQGAESCITELLRQGKFDSSTQGAASHRNKWLVIREAPKKESEQSSRNVGADGRGVSVSVSPRLSSESSKPVKDTDSVLFAKMSGWDEGYCRAMWKRFLREDRQLAERRSARMANLLKEVRRLTDAVEIATDDELLEVTGMLRMARVELGAFAQGDDSDEDSDDEDGVYEEDDDF